MLFDPCIEGDAFNKEYVENQKKNLKDDIDILNTECDIELNKTDLIIESHNNILNFYMESQNNMKRLKKSWNTVANAIKTAIKSVSSFIVKCVDKVKEITTKSGAKMVFISGSDELSNIDLTVFPDTYKEMEHIEKGDILLARARVEKRYDQYQLIVNKIKRIKIEK